MFGGACVIPKLQECGCGIRKSKLGVVQMSVSDTKYAPGLTGVVCLHVTVFPEKAVRELAGIDSNVEYLVSHTHSPQWSWAPFRDFFGFMAL